MLILLQLDIRYAPVDLQQYPITVFEECVSLLLRERLCNLYLMYC